MLLCCAFAGEGVMENRVISAANRYTTLIHIHVRDFIFFSSELVTGDSDLPRVRIADENREQVHKPERKGIPISSSAPAKRTLPIVSVSAPGETRLTNHRDLSHPPLFLQDR